MWIFYVSTLIPLVVGAVFWYYFNKIVWWEWLTGFGVQIVLACVFHAIAVHGMTGDVETWSGQISTAEHHPQWVERYTVVVDDSYTDSRGHTHHSSHTEVRYTTHQEYWSALTSIGDSHRISETFFREISGRFANLTVETPYKSGFYSGDRHVYVSYNKSGYIFPVTGIRNWSNRVKAAPSLFSFPAVPKTARVFEYPENKDWTKSDRLLGTAVGLFSIRQMDLMNSSLGPLKHVNVILVGFPETESENIANYQQAKWIGGKKNDIVICFGGGGQALRPSWCQVFGWTEKELVKENLKTIVLSNPINNDLFPLIQQEIVSNYKIKDWSKFDYITIEPPTWSYVVYFIVMIVVQSALVFFWFNNDADKEDAHGYYSRPYSPGKSSYKRCIHKRI